ncbi:MAG: uroporphyrinogen decarboxylase family protein [Armatimonadota bacterium]
MTSRERVKRAIHFQGPDHVPHYLPDGKENDIMWLWIPRPEDIRPWTQLQDGRSRRVDAWGVVWETVSPGSFGEAVEYPIMEIARQLEYVLPDLNNPTYFEGAKRTIAENNASENPSYCLGVLPFNSLNECTHNIMGLPNMFLAYYEHPDDLKSLIGRLAEAQRESIRRLARIGCDGVMGYDDWGLQDRLMVSPDIVEEFFMPHYRENWQLAHDLGLDVWMHSCGYIIELLPRFADSGLDVIQMDQQENMGLEKLDEVMGGKIAFWCPVDVQKTMVYGIPDDVREYVKRLVGTVGAHNGGLVSMAYTTPEAVGHAQENTTAMCEAFREWGTYCETKTTLSA